MTNLALRFRNKAQEIFPGATVHARTRTGILHRHPTDLNRFIFDGNPASIHYGAQFNQEIDTAWEVSTLQPWLFQMVKADYNVYLMPGNETFDSGQLVRYVDPGTGAEITFQPQQLQWTNDLDQVQAVGSVANVAGVVLGNTCLWVGAYGLGFDFQYQVETERVQKKLTIASALLLGSPNATILAGGNPVLRMQFIFQKTTGVQIFLNGVLWNEAGNNPITTNATVEFKVNNVTKWVFKPAYAEDANGVRITPVYKFRKQGNNLFVEIRTPWTGFLNTATFPVTIDPTVDVGVSAGNMDAHEASDGANFSSGATALRAESSGTASNRYFSEGIFTVTGPASGDTVNVAYITIKAVSTATDDPNVDLKCEDVDSAADFTATADVTSRTRTASSVQWTATGIGTGAVNSPSIVTPVQAILNRAGWVSGNKLGIFADGRSDAAQTFRTIPYDSSSTDCWQFHLEYTAAATSNPHKYLPLLGVG